MIFGTDVSKFQTKEAILGYPFTILNVEDPTFAEKAQFAIDNGIVWDIYKWIYPPGATDGSGRPLRDAGNGAESFAIARELVDQANFPGRAPGYWADYEQGGVEARQVGEWFGAADQAGVQSGLYTYLFVLNAQGNHAPDRPLWLAYYPSPNDGSYDPSMSNDARAQGAKLYQFTSTHDTLDVNVVIDEAWWAGWAGGSTPGPVNGVRWPLEEVRINSPYGPRDGGFHHGVDLWATVGTPVYACGPGTVFYTAFEDDGGNHLVHYLDNPPTPDAPKSGYMHLSRFIAGPNQHVEAGDLIALSGSTGQITGPHLHWWLGRSGSDTVNPVDYIATEPPPQPEPPKPPPNAKEASEMYIVVQSDDLTRCWLMCGNVRVLDFEGPPDPQYGLPQDALRYADGGNGAHLPIRPLSDFQMMLLDAVSKKLFADAGFPAQT